MLGRLRKSIALISSTVTLCPSPLWAQHHETWANHSLPDLHTWITDVRLVTIGRIVGKIVPPPSYLSPPIDSTHPKQKRKAANRTCHYKEKKRKKHNNPRKCWKRFEHRARFRRTPRTSPVSRDGSLACGRSAARLSFSGYSKAYLLPVVFP